VNKLPEVLFHDSLYMAILDFKLTQIHPSFKD
jgi:hypothetical protein